jgi:hypothetical protein
MDFKEALEKYVETIQSIHDEYFDEHFKNLDHLKIEVEPRGRRYKKVVTDNGTQRMVHSFVEVKTGLIFKPASWKAPAKHARGSIYKNNGRDALTPYGSVRYLK